MLANDGGITWPLDTLDEKTGEPSMVMVEKKGVKNYTFDKYDIAEMNTIYFEPATSSAKLDASKTSL